MFKNVARNSVVGLFGFVARLRLHRAPFFNRLFQISYTIYKAYFEAGPIDRLKEYVPPGSLVVDVGANIGFFSCRFAEWVGDDGKVISIEPEDHNYNCLLSALARKGLLQRVWPLKAVAAAKPGAAFLEINPLHPADHKLSRDSTGFPVTAVTLDDLIRENDGLVPSLVKIDVQGAEMLVLLGASGILRYPSPPLFIELDEEGLNKFGTSVSAILDHLSGEGYVPHWLVQSGEHLRASVSDIHARVARLGYVDVLFLKTSPNLVCGRSS